MNRDKWLQLYRRIFPDTPLFGKIELGLRILLVFFVLLIFLAQGKFLFNIPIDKPYHTGKTDDPFAINAGINVLKNKGNPEFYNYGGTCIYPYSLVYHYYCKEKGITPVYKIMDKPYASSHWPATRKTYPVKPIYITKVIARGLYILGGFIYTALFSFLLVPVPFWLIGSMKSSGTLRGYADHMMPETHLGIMAGLTTIFFAKAVLEDKISRYYIWTVICAVSAALTVAVKINSFYILLLPLSLLWRLVKEKYLTLKRTGLLAGAFIIPYILVNPSVILDFGGYLRWIRTMKGLSDAQTQGGSLSARYGTIVQFLKDLYLPSALPAVIVVILFISCCILLAKKNPSAFFGFMLFILVSFYTLISMRNFLYPRHFIFLLLPVNLLFLYPLVHIYLKSPKSIKAGITLICLVATLWAFPPVKTIKEISKLPRHNFTLKWKKESRDDLVEFVKSENARIYFYDFHGFSLPENIYTRLIPFSLPGHLPEKLGGNEYVAYIRYAGAEEKDLNPNGKYNRDTKYLTNRYSVYKVFGPPGGAHDINYQGPQNNPTIVILKENP